MFHVKQGPRLPNVSRETHLSIYGFQPPSYIPSANFSAAMLFH